MWNIFNEKSEDLPKRFCENFPGNKLSSSEINIKAEFNNSQQFIVSLQNNLGEHVDIGYDNAPKQYFLDRTHSGISSFSAAFPQRQIIPLQKNPEYIHFRIFYDRSSIEVFINEGEWVFTDLVFPTKLYDQLKIGIMGNSAKIEELKISTIQSVWRKE